MNPDTGHAGSEGNGASRRSLLSSGGSTEGAPSKQVSFTSGPTSPRPISRKPTPFNSDLTAEIKKAGLDAVFPDDAAGDGAAVAAAAAAAGGLREEDAATPLGAAEVDVLEKQAREAAEGGRPARGSGGSGDGAGGIP